MISLFDVGMDGPPPLLRGVSVTIERGDRWGIVGRNTIRARERAEQECATEVQRIESEVARLRAALADPMLYADARGALHASQLKRELDALEASLVVIQTWHEAFEAAARSTRWR